MHIRYYVLLIVIFGGQSYATSADRHDAFKGCSWFYGAFFDSGSEVSVDTKELKVLRKVSLSSLFHFLSSGIEANDDSGKGEAIIDVEENENMDVYKKELSAGNNILIRSIKKNECIGDQVFLMSKISARIGDGLYVPLATKIFLKISSLNDGSISVVVTKESRQLDFGFIPSSVKTVRSYRFLPFLQPRANDAGAKVRRYLRGSWIFVEAIGAGAKVRRYLIASWIVEMELDALSQRRFGTAEGMGDV